VPKRGFGGIAILPGRGVEGKAKTAQQPRLEDLEADEIAILSR
jgi:hypothetical protein